MPQITILPTIFPTPPPSLPTGASEPSSFSPHLKEAIQKIIEQAENPSSEHGAKTSDHPDSATNTGSSDIALLQGIENPGINSEPQGDDILPPAIHLLDSTLLNRGEGVVSTFIIPAAANPGLHGTPQLAEAASIVSMLVDNTIQVQQGVIGQSSQNPSTQNIQGLLLPSIQHPSKQASGVEVSPPLTAVTSAEHGNPLIKQLQNIIDGGENGITLSITSSGNALRVSTNGGTITARTDTLPQQPIEAAISLNEPGEAGTMPSYGALRFESGIDQQQGPTTLRQSLQQQYFEGKLTTETKNETNSGTGDKHPQNGTNTPPAGTAATHEAATLPTTEAPTAFSHLLTQSSSSYKPLGHEPLQPVLLPSGNVVYQEEVIRHIAERFHIMRRDSDTRVNLQLHPAELGELRIDLSVKNGTVRANVVAATQIAQDIIEKNLPRLRSLLEQQGFSIDKIFVSNSSPAVNDFNLFDRQHYDDRESYPSSSPRGENATAVFTLDNLNSVQEEAIGSVNVKI